MSGNQNSDTSVDERGKIIADVRQVVRDLDVYDVRTRDSIVTKLNQNESPFDVPAHMKREIVDRLITTSWNRYPSAHSSSLREAIASKLGLSSSNVIVGNGSNDLAQTIIMTIVDPGCTVVLPTPMFFLYSKLVKIAGSNVVSIAADEPTFDIDPDTLVDTVRRTSPRLTVITTPNNPTGREIDFDVIREIAGLRKGIVLVDEAYYEFSERRSSVELVSEYENVLVLRTFSKACSLAGVRAGYLVGSDKLISQILKVRLPFMVDRFSEVTALYLLENSDWIDEKVKQVKQLSRELQMKTGQLPGCTIVESASNFFLFRPERDAVKVMEQLADRGILVRQMSSYPLLSKYLRVSTGTDAENRMFLNALLSILED